MREALLWIEKVLPKKPLIPVYSHVAIRDHRVTATDGNIVASYPVADALTASPNGQMLVDAFKGCGQNEHIALSQLDNGSLVVKRNRVKITIPCTTDPFPTFPSGGTVIAAPFQIRKALMAIRKFVSEDNCRPLFRSVFFRGQSLFASNNVTIAQYWGGGESNANFAIPVESVDALIAIPEEPAYIEISQNWVRFHYTNGAWLFTNLVVELWPDLEKFMVGPWDLPVATPALWEAISTLKPFLASQNDVRISGGAISTPAAEAVVPDLMGELSCSYKHLAQLRGTASAIQFSIPIRWMGDSIRGVTFGRSL